MSTKPKRGRRERDKPPITILISGTKGSGKTTIASILAKALRVAGWKHVWGDEEVYWDLRSSPHRAAGWLPRAQEIEILSR